MSPPLPTSELLPQHATEYRRTPCAVFGMILGTPYDSVVAVLRLSSPISVILTGVHDTKDTCVSDLCSDQVSKKFNVAELAVACPAGAVPLGWTGWRENQQGSNREKNGEHNTDGCTL